MDEIDVILGPAQQARSGRSRTVTAGRGPVRAAAMA